MKQTKQQIISLAYQKIKANDQLLQRLADLENVLLKLYDPITNYSQPAKDLIYKDREGNVIEMECFYEDLQHFINRNETMLRNDSAECFETLKKQHQI